MESNKIIDYTKIVANRYHTADPFTIADHLNIDWRWTTLGKRPLGKTMYDIKDEPIVLLNSNIRNSPQRMFVMAHELGHVILQEGLVGYYTSNKFNHAKLEVEADEFASTLLAQLYIEEHGCLPETWNDLVHEYGYPSIIN